jgi:hypothetical protein
VMWTFLRRGSWREVSLTPCVNWSNSWGPH